MMKITIKILVLYAFLQIMCSDAKPASLNLSLHRRMDPISLKHIFHVKSYEEVPEYEIVHIRELPKSSDEETKILHLSAFGKDIHLHLRRSEDFDERLKTTKLFTAESSKNGIRFAEVFVEDNDSGTTYQDINLMAAVSVHQGVNGELQMVSLFTLISVLMLSVSFNDIWENQQLVNDNHRDKRRAVLDKVWPEVLLLVDYDTYTEHISYNLTETQIRRYYSAFLNGVDLRFKAFTDPQISLILAGIIISKDKNAAPYLENNKLSSPDDYAFNGEKALKDLSHYLYSAKGLPEYDLALLLTELDMCMEKENECVRHTAGLAYYRGACFVRESLGRVMKIGIVEDKGGFDGIIGATHEIGHLLGSLHDGDSQLDALSGPGAESCGFEEGFLMSYAENTETMFQWSECSLEQIKYFLNTEEASCLRNEPDNKNLLGGELPGTMLSLDEQCERNWATRACANDSRVCLQLHCYYDDGECVPLLPAAEGSVCGDSQICKDGRCVKNHVINNTILTEGPICNDNSTDMY
ncbi:A disintegrin and metalloproteinase with like protein [Argiope bruennichi]|uniref:A disintegrin and metalloproteinase with like protein n=1 Tax=Argiope bruennichi TaxID=94029 RepID=A0A8T0EGC8_ARGBR|nr:A disintegrin and metalloproteinase with like protein [Argiope bruennichi]